MKPSPGRRDTRRPGAVLIARATHVSDAHHRWAQQECDKHADHVCPGRRCDGDKWHYGKTHEEGVREEERRRAEDGRRNATLVKPLGAAVVAR